jgi:hypothetical protein
MATDYSSLNASFLGDYTKSAGLSNFKLDSSYDSAWKAVDYGPFSTSPNVPDFGGDVLSATPQSGQGDAWVFITAPGSVSWNVNSEIQRIEIFGSNTPPVVASSRGMRDLSLSEALMEGFTLGKSVQKEIDELEALMDVEVDSGEGFVNVPVYDVKAGGKSYGLYVIESIDIDEQMRDLQGRATRAMVGVQLKQVPEYQVGKGIDQAGASSGGQALDASKFTQADKQASNIAKNGNNTPSTAGANNGTDPNKNPPKVEDLDPSKRAY